jgi:transcriptional regulator with XRE-family HTH domain
VTQDWPEGLHRRIAAGLKNARGTRSAQWLADETERLGYPISRAALANYESGRKKGLDVAELLVLAAALKVPPIVLLYPELPDGVVEVLPGVTATSWDAAAWFSGEELSPDQPNDDGEPYSATREFELIRAVREQRAQLLSAAQFYESMERFARGVLPGQKRVDPRDPMMRALQEQVETVSSEIKRLDAVIRENGGVVGDE